MNSGEKTTFQNHLNANMATVRGKLGIGPAASAVAKKTNYEEIRKLLRSLNIAGTDPNVKEAAAMIAKKAKIKNLDFQAIVVLLEDPGPEVDVPKEIKKIKDDVGHAIEVTELDGEQIPAIYVQLDDAQMKHQPASVPIGTRVKEGEKFGTYATKDWHEANTMLYMAGWAYRLTGLVEGVKREHGQLQKINHPTVGPISYEGFCMLLGGKRYVSFHCYPNSRK
jgi:hypothetical protein